jgi:hypothetical protein
LTAASRSSSMWQRLFCRAAHAQFVNFGPKLHKTSPHPSRNRRFPFNRQKAAFVHVRSNVLVRIDALLTRLPLQATKFCQNLMA